MLVECWDDLCCSYYSKVAKLVDALLSTQKSVEWGGVVDKQQTRVVGDYIFKSMQVRVLPLHQIIKLRLWMLFG